VRDAFAHHTWATKRLAEACRALTTEQLTTEVAGTYGSILATLRHMVADDWFYLGVLTGERPTLTGDPQAMNLGELAEAIEVLGASWSKFVAGDINPDVMVKEVDDTDGFERDAPLGVHLAQALHHGNEHRTQIRTALTVLGVEPPRISVFHFALETGRSVERYP
jgi:uncharacterized damage-inducible protein DinB